MSSSLPPISADEKEIIAADKTKQVSNQSGRRCMLQTVVASISRCEELSVLKSLQFAGGNIVSEGEYRYFYLWKLYAPLVEFLPTISLH